MIKLNTLQAKWESYLKEVLPKDASSTQIIETKRGFYAGALSLFNLQMSITEGLTEEAEEAMMSGWSDELAQFAAAIKLGRA